MPSISTLAKNGCSRIALVEPSCTPRRLKMKEMSKEIRILVMEYTNDVSGTYSAGSAFRICPIKILACGLPAC